MIERNAQSEMRRFFHVWKCSKKRECKPWGVEPKEPCGRWNIKSSKWNIGEHPHLKGNCRCGNAPRLNLHHPVYTYETKEAAEMMVEALNREGGQ